MRFNWAPHAARLLNGVFCVYKPNGISEKRLVETIKENLARDLNKLPCYNYERVKTDSNKNQRDIKTAKGKHGTSENQIANLAVQSSYYTPTITTLPTVTEDLSEHRLVLGERYLPSDFRISFVNGLSYKSSGVLVCGIGSASTDTVDLLQTAQFLRVYHVKGRFGYATQNFFPDGPLIERTTYHHVNKVLIDKVCASIQANHQKHIFEYAGVHPQSDEAYQMACKGLVRPDTRDTPPMIYGVKCIHFDLPEVTLEIHAINEDSLYLAKIIHDLGLRLKSTAVCPQVRRIRDGQFTLEHALLRKDWHLEPIIDNIELCRQLTETEKLVSDFNIEKVKDDLKQLPDGSDGSLLDLVETKDAVKTVEKYLDKVEHV